jgi:mannose-6-phosphate isomerase-like protein (cupin superfamily)
LKTKRQQNPDRFAGKVHSSEFRNPKNSNNEIAFSNFSTEHFLLASGKQRSPAENASLAAKSANLRDTLEETNPRA